MSSGFFTSPTWSPQQPPVPLGALGSVLTVTSGGLAFQAGGGGVATGRATSALASGPTNNLNPSGGIPGAGRLILTAGSGAANITGLVAGSDGQWLFIYNNDGTNNVTLNSLNAGSTSANQFKYFADLVLPPGAGVVAMYDSTIAKWLLS